MNRKNRVCIVLNEENFFEGYVSDEPVEFFVVAPHCPKDRVYQFGSGEHGPEHVRKLIGGYPVGHIADGTLSAETPDGEIIGEPDGRGKLPPSRPALTVVRNETET